MIAEKILVNQNYFCTIGVNDDSFSHSSLSLHDIEDDSVVFLDNVELCDDKKDEWPYYHLDFTDVINFQIIDCEKVDKKISNGRKNRMDYYHKITKRKYNPYFCRIHHLPYWNAMVTKVNGKILSISGVLNDRTLGLDLFLFGDRFCNGRMESRSAHLIIASSDTDFSQIIWAEKSLNIGDDIEISFTVTDKLDTPIRKIPIETQ